MLLWITPNGVTHYNMPLSTTNIRIVLRSFSVRSPLVLRSFSVRSPFVLRSAIEERTENHRRNIGESSEARRRCIETLMGNQGKGDPNKNFIFNHLNSKLLWQNFFGF